MISELMASQAFWGSQYQRNEEEEGDENEDGVVPGSSRNSNENSKGKQCQCQCRINYAT